MRGFMRYSERAEVVFPDRGIVLVTGANGEGKSSLIEGASVALFGKTVRGTSPWQANCAGEVSLQTEKFSVRRTHSAGGKNQTFFSVAGTADAEYENVSKANEAITAVVGDFDVWRRACVFSSHDAAHFTLATDAERKRLLEAAIGLTVFDDALTACRKDLTEASSRQSIAASKVAQLGERLAGARTRLDDAMKVLKSTPQLVDIPTLETRRAKAVKLRAELDHDIRKAMEPIAAASREAVGIETHIGMAKQSIRSAQAGTCPTCGAKIAAKDDLIQSLTSKVEDFTAKLADAQARARNQGEIPQLEADRNDLDQKLSEINIQLLGASETSRRREQAESVVAATKKAVEESSAGLDNIIAEEKVAAARVLLLDTVSSVLGTRGVRAQVLSRSLASMEAVANLWLAKVAGDGLRLRMRSFTEKKTGGVSDAISLDVEGAGGGLGYRASSGGERRRLDIAITLALSEVAAASRGEAPGIIFLDELLDCLDADGTAAALSAVRALGETRCVVLITHSEEVLAQLTPTLRLRVADGKVVSA